MIDGAESLPDIVNYCSVHEDIGQDDLQETIRSLFYIEKTHRQFLLHFEIERLIYFFFGRRKLPSKILGGLIKCLEAAVLFITRKPDYMLFLGKNNK